jgi:hypothetical protein
MGIGQKADIGQGIRKSGIREGKVPMEKGRRPRGEGGMPKEVETCRKKTTRKEGDVDNDDGRRKMEKMEKLEEMCASFSRKSA